MYALLVGYTSCYLKNITKEGLMIYNNVVIHELRKERHGQILPSNNREKVLIKAPLAVTSLVGNIIERYGKKHNTAQYGVFSEGEGRGTFPDHFQTYYDIQEKSNIDFMALSTHVMSALFESAQYESLATGGYIVVIDYEEGQNRYILIAMIKKRPGITLSDDLTPEELMSLDLDRLNQAARINFSKLSEYLTAPDIEKAELNYLSFVSPAGNSAASGYFIKGLGCQKGTASASATKSLFKECKNFFKDTPELRNKCQDFMNDLEHYLEEKVELGQPVRLSEVDAIARNNFPVDIAERHDEFSESFYEHMSDEEKEIPNEFSVSKSMLEKLVSIKYKTANWNIKFERASLGPTVDAEIYYDQQNGHLVFTQLDESLRNMIEDQLTEFNRY